MSHPGSKCCRADCRILIVDDNRDFSESLADILESQGVSVSIAIDIASARKSMESSGADVALLDIRLGQEDGLQLIPLLQELNPELISVVVTAYADSETAVDALKKGAYDYLQKPFSHGDLFATVQRCCEKIETLRAKRSAEESCRESEERFRSLVANIPGAVYRSSCDETLTVRYFSPTISEITGYPAGELIDSERLGYEKLIHPDDAKERHAVLQGGMASQQPVTCEYRIVHADGSLRWVEERAQTALAGDSRTRYLDGVILDVTEKRRHSELVQHLTHSILANTGGDFFLNLLHNLSIVLNADYAFVGRIKKDDPGVVESILAFSDGELVPNFDYDLSGTPCEQVLKTKKVCIYPKNVQQQFPADKLLVEMGVESYAGTQLWSSDGHAFGLIVVLCRQSCEDSALAESLLQIFADRASVELERLDQVEEVRASERRYRQLSQEYQTVLEGIPDALVLFDTDMKIVWANRGAKELSDLGFDDLRGIACSSFWRCPTDQCENCVRQVFNDSGTFETVKKTPQGTVWGVKGFPVKDAEGKIVNVIQVASDLTEKVQLREQAAHSAHLAALGELAAGVAHEINNPTGLILLDMPVLKDAFDEILPLLDEHARTMENFRLAGLPYERMRQEVPEIIEEVVDGARRIKHIVEELKDFSKPSSENRERVDLNDVVRKAVNLTRAQLSNATGNFSDDYAQASLYCCGSPQRLEQVVVNLLLNACQSLTDRTCAIAIGTFENKIKGTIGLVVSDEGVGIAKENLAQITDPFFTTKRQTGGSGLGLSVSSRIVAEHQGELLFKSEVGHGTIVTLELPQS